MLRLNQDEFEFPILAIIRQSYINHSIIKPKDGDEINFQKMAVKIVKEYSDLDLAGKIAELLGILYSIQNESIRYKLIEKLFALPDIYSVMQLDKIINNTMKAVNAKEITNDNLSIVMNVPHELFNSFSENIPAYIEIITQDQTEQIARFLFNLFIAKYPEHELPADLINIIALKINKRLESANAEPIQQALVKLFDAPMYVWLLVISIAVKMDITLDALPTAISILADLTACKVLTLKHQNLLESK